MLKSFALATNGGSNRTVPFGGTVFGFRFAPPALVKHPEGDASTISGGVPDHYPLGLEVHGDHGGSRVLVRSPSWHKFQQGVRSASILNSAEMIGSGFNESFVGQPGGAGDTVSDYIVDVATSPDDFLSDNQRTFVTRHTKRFENSIPTMFGVTIANIPDGDVQWIRACVTVQGSAAVMGLNEIIVNMGGASHSLRKMSGGLFGASYIGYLPPPSEPYRNIVLDDSAAYAMNVQPKTFLAATDIAVRY